jgi:hypothetical protein
VIGARNQRLREDIEVAALARQPMHAEYTLSGRRISPLPPGHAVAAGGIGARQVIQRRFGHAGEKTNTVWLLFALDAILIEAATCGRCRLVPDRWEQSLQKQIQSSISVRISAVANQPSPAL